MKTIFSWILCLFAYGLTAQMPSNCANPVLTPSSSTDYDPSWQYDLSTPYVTVDITYFGAVANNNGSDHDAFEAASLFFQARGGQGELHIPAGEYIVGKQIPGGGGYYLQGQHPLDLTNCSNMLVFGDLLGNTPATTLRLDACLSYGAFDPNSGDRKLPICDPNCVTSGAGQYAFLASLGSMIHLRNSEEITIKNIEFDGNSGSLTLGGKWGDKGIQASGDGIAILNSRDITIDHCDMHDQGRDGVITFSDDPNFASTNAVITFTSMNCNGRLGMSLGGGNDFMVSDCEFNYNGFGYMVSAPAAGVDIEFHNGNDVMNSEFIRCDFKFNRSWGLICDMGNSIHVRNHQFKNCEFVGSAYGPAARANGRAFKFFTCDFYGPVSRVYNLGSSDPQSDATYMHRCSFFDEYMGEMIGNPNNNYPNNWCLNSAGGSGLHLEHCDFNTRCGLFGFWINANAARPATIENCTWRFTGRSQNVQQATCGNCQVIGFFDHFYPNIMPGDCGFSAGFDYDLLVPPVIVGSAGYNPINTGQGPNCCTAAIGYQDPVFPSPSTCYAGTDCTVFQYLPAVPQCTPCQFNELQLELDMDDGAQITWEILDGSGNVVADGGPYAAGPASIIESGICLPDDCYHLVVEDNNGNGMTEYTLLDHLSNPIIIATGDFGASSEIVMDSNTFGNQDDFCLPLSNTTVSANSCLKYEHDDHDAIYVDAVAGATQYRFWYFDPHGTANRVHLSQTGDAFGGLRYWPIGLPEDLDLNVRVQALNSSGQALGNFGPACALRIVSGEFDCPTTHLIDNPGNAQHSCSDDIAPYTNPHPIDNSSTIFATEVEMPNGTPANRYQFRLENTALGYVRYIAPSSGRALNISSISSTPLTPGYVYDVYVRASWDGGATYPCDAQWGSGIFKGQVCQVEFFQNVPRLQAFTDGGKLKLVPNPLTDNHFSIELTSEALKNNQEVNLTIYDAQGQLVQLEKVFAQEGRLTKQISLKESVQAGIYFVELTLDSGVKYIERLVILR